MRTEAKEGEVGVTEMVTTHVFSTMDFPMIWGSLKAYFDSGEERGIEPYTKSIEYSYTMWSPQIYRLEEDGGAPG